ncbi:MAG: hypothetical protein SNJ69_03370 [Chloroflexaceae bacterium]
MPDELWIDATPRALPPGRYQLPGVVVANRGEIVVSFQDRVTELAVATRRAAARHLAATSRGSETRKQLLV